MVYPVLKPFLDKEDDKREYRSNDWYPRFNFEVSDERVEQLTSKGFIQAEKDEEYPVHTGGGWYELSNGERVQGKDNAVKEQKKLGD